MSDYLGEEIQIDGYTIKQETDQLVAKRDGDTGGFLPLARVLLLPTSQAPTTEDPTILYLYYEDV